MVSPRPSPGVARTPGMSLQVVGHDVAVVRAHQVAGPYPAAGPARIAGLVVEHHVAVFLQLAACHVLAGGGPGPEGVSVGTVARVYRQVRVVEAAEDEVAVAMERQPERAGR